ncbi:MAG: DMT family transporter [Bdellovibrionota bacterium]
MTPGVLIALLVVQLLFGLNYVISKVVVGSFPPLLWASFRVIVSAVVMICVALASGRKHPKVSGEFFGKLVLFSLLGIILNQGSFLLGLKYTTSTNSAVLNTLIPIFTLVIVTVRGQEPLTSKRALGFVCAFVGVLAIRKVENFSFSDSTLIGDLLTMFNCLCYAFFLSYSKKFLEKHDSVWTTAWLFIYGSVGLTLIALPDWIHFKLPPIDEQLLACMTFAILGGTLLTYFLSLWALARIRATSTVALFVYLQPVVATAFAWAWKGELITSRTALSSFLIFCGMLLALTPGKSSPPMRQE